MYPPCAVGQRPVGSSRQVSLLGRYAAPVDPWSSQQPPPHMSTSSPVHTRTDGTVGAFSDASARVRQRLAVGSKAALTMPRTTTSVPVHTARL
jgi:hypothetical protein